MIPNNTRAYRKAYYNKIVEPLRTAYKEAEYYRNRIKELSEMDKQGGRGWTTSEIAEGISTATDKLHAVVEGAQAKIRAAYETEIETIERAFVVDGKQLTADAELLRYELTGEQLQQLADRASQQGNATMIALINNHAAARNIPLAISAPTAKELTAGAAKLYREAQSDLAALEGINASPVTEKYIAIHFDGWNASRADSEFLGW